MKTSITLSNRTVNIYAGARVAQALHEVTEGMDLYKGVRLSQLFDAVYKQGTKDGARIVRDAFEKMMDKIPHKNPGQPKKKKKAHAQ